MIDRFNSVQSRIILLISILVIVFLAGIYLQNNSESKRLELLLKNEEDQKNILLQNTIELQGKSLQVFAYDYTYWDELLNFVQNPDTQWAKININDVLPTFNVSGTKILNKNFKTIYTAVSDNNFKALDRIIDSQVNTGSLTSNPFQHFYLMILDELIEIRTAPVQPSDDVNRSTPPKGFMIAYRVWDKQFLDVLGIILSSTIKLIKPEIVKTDLIIGGGETTSITSSIVLTDQEKKPVCQLLVISKSEIIERLLSIFNYQYNLTIIFAVIIMVTISIFLFLYVNHPLKLITRSLENEDPGSLISLSKVKNEFGRYALLIIQFFGQKSNLEREIIERKKIEKSLKESEQLYKTIFDTSADAFVFLDKDFIAAYISHRFTELTSYKLDDLSGKNYFRTVIHHSPDILAEVAASEALKKIIGPFDSVLKSINDKTIYVNIIMSPVKIKDEPYLLIRYTDIGEKKLLEAETEKHQKQIQQAGKLASLGLLVAGVAHEINNPNAFISVNIPYIRQYFYEIFPILDEYYTKHPGFKIGKVPYDIFKDDVSDLLNDLREGTDRINRIVNDLKDFAKVDLEIKYEECNLTTIIETSLRLLANQVKSKNAIVVFDHSKNVLVFGDAHKLGQVMINVLVNAVEAVKQGKGKIEITYVEKAEGDLVCRVSDNGHGISAKEIEKVFDPFYTTKGATGGTGLGLSVSRSIMESMGHGISIESEEKIGTTVSLIFSGKK